MTPWTVAHQLPCPSLWSWPKYMSIESVMPSNLLELKAKPSQVGTQGQLFSHHLTDLMWQGYPVESVASLLPFSYLHLWVNFFSSPNSVFKILKIWTMVDWQSNSAPYYLCLCTREMCSGIVWTWWERKANRQLSYSPLMEVPRKENKGRALHSTLKERAPSCPFAVLALW